MARMQVRGIEEYALKLSKLGDRSDEIAGKAIYQAADIIADAIKNNIKQLPTVSDRQNILAYVNGGKSGITERQKQGLIDSFGISRMRNDSGYLNVKIGFDGYNMVRTHKYPNGQPNQMIARVMESGSVYMDKHPYIRPAVTANKKNAVQSMNDVIDTEISKIIQ